LPSADLQVGTPPVRVCVNDFNDSDDGRSDELKWPCACTSLAASTRDWAPKSMRETRTEMSSPGPLRKFSHQFLGAAMFLIGILAGRAFFPLEVPKPFVVERRVDFPVDRIVEKRVEVPVEVVKFVDRIVEKRVEVPVERVVYVDRIATKPVSRSTGESAWMQLSKGLSRSDVLAILGEPRKIDGGNVFEDWYYGAPGGARVAFMNGQVYTWVSP